MREIYHSSLRAAYVCVRARVRAVNVAILARLGPSREVSVTCSSTQWFSKETLASRVLFI
jgi:hypothetical protein